MDVARRRDELGGMQSAGVVERVEISKGILAWAPGFCAIGIAEGDDTFLARGQTSEVRRRVRVDVRDGWSSALNVDGLEVVPVGGFVDAY